MRRLFPCGLLFIILAVLPVTSFAVSEEEMETLRMFYGDSDLVTSSTRSEQPVSHVAENMTVITAADLRRVNAHTVLDALYWITGIEVVAKGPGGLNTEVMIQGANFGHIRVLLDGVTLNNYSDNFPDLSLIPAQIVERIEIIMGPASSAWGSSLGGVINIITKSPADTPVSGEGAGSGGSRGTIGIQGELSGSVNGLGYYLAGSELRTDGLRPERSVQQADTYGKLTLESDDSVTRLTAGHFHGKRSITLLPAALTGFPDGLLEENPESKLVFATFSHRRKFGERFAVESSLRVSEQKVSIALSSGGAPFMTIPSRELTIGGSVLGSWRGENNSVTTGVDFDFAHSEMDVPYLEPYLRTWGFFASDTVTAGQFSFTPGVRYDYVNTVRGLFSPSLGITWSPASTTVFRLYGGRGFSLPQAKQNLNPERVFSLQAGVEQSVADAFWLKTSAFHNDLSDVIDGLENKGKQRKQGFQVEVKTVAVFNTSLSAGYVFTDVTDRETGRIVPGSPRYTVDAGLHYGQSLFRASLLGHYIWYTPSPAFYHADYRQFVWDLSLSRKIPVGEREIEIFFNGHNLLDGSQYTSDYEQNPGRWFEGGLRFRF